MADPSLPVGVIPDGVEGASVDVGVITGVTGGPEAERSSTNGDGDVVRVLGARWRKGRSRKPGGASSAGTPRAEPKEVVIKHVKFADTA